MPERLITQSAFATTMGVDKAQVTRWIAKGMPAASGGINPATAATWVRENVDPTQRNHRSRGANEIADAAAERRLEALDAMGRTALRLAIHAVPGVARDAALDSGATPGVAEAIFDAACKRAPGIEVPVLNMMLIPENDAEPFTEITQPAELGQNANGGATLLWERTRVARAQADALEFANDLRRAQVVEIADATKLVGQQYARVRTRLLAIPAEAAARLARVETPAEAQAVLQALIVSALEELVDPSFEGGADV